MPNNTDYRGWVRVLSSVRTPLGFFTLLALIINAGLVVGASLGEVPIWLPSGLLALLIVSVTITLWKKPDVFDPKKTLTVSFVFPTDIDAIDVNFSVDKCTIEIRNLEGRRTHQGTPNLIFGEGGWTCRLPEYVEPSDSVRLELIENNGRMWRVHPFSPYQTAKKVLQA